jgi:hypothetical protein
VEVVSHCPKCYKAARFESAAAPTEVVCPKCGERRDVRLSASILEKNVVDQCALCGCGHLYLEKDVNGVLGFAVIVAAIVLSGIFWARNVYLSVGILGAAALLDLVVWLLARERAVCYKCVAVYRKAAPNSALERYDLGVAGRFADDYDEQRELRSKSGP